jgi:hypothetical protein
MRGFYTQILLEHSIRNWDASLCEAQGSVAYSMVPLVYVPRMCFILLQVLMQATQGYERAHAKSAPKRLRLVINTHLNA